ncbi:MAG: hypothetical protein UHO61_05270 [Acutalibacteraceae bacterium]|nr:hypothetical protein [Acutalibacteraceae bacterium]
MCDSAHRCKCDTVLNHTPIPAVNSHALLVRHADMASILCDSDQCCKNYMVLTPILAVR